MEIKRVAFKMKLKAGCEAEYKKRHNEIFPELVELIKGSGVFDYSIYHDSETNILFACLKIKDNLPNLETIDNPVVRRWWDFMSDIMEANADNSPIETPLSELFYLP